MPTRGIDLGLCCTGRGAHTVGIGWLAIHGVPDIDAGGTIHGFGRFLSGPIPRDEQRRWFQVGARFAGLFGGWAGVWRRHIMFLGRVLRLRIVGTQWRGFLRSQSGLWGLIAVDGDLLLPDTLIGKGDRTALGTTGTRRWSRRGECGLFDDG